MTEFQFTNNAETTLAEAIGTGDSSLSVKTGEGSKFPSPSTGEGFYILVEEGSVSEWMLVTTRSSDTFSGITRAASPQSFNAGATVKLAISATILAQFQQKGVHRTVTSSPDGSLAALYSGEEVYDSVAEQWYKHTTGTEWKMMGIYEEP